MTVRIRLMRVGKKNQPRYKIVAVDKRKRRDGAYIEKIGNYNPLTNPATVNVDDEKLTKWINNGAQLSEKLAKILRQKSKKATS